MKHMKSRKRDTQHGKKHNMFGLRALFWNFFLEPQEGYSDRDSTKNKKKTRKVGEKCKKGRMKSKEQIF